MMAQLKEIELLSALISNLTECRLKVISSLAKEESS